MGVVSNAAVSLRVHVGYTPRSGTAGAEGLVITYWLEKLLDCVPKWSHHLAVPQQREGSASSMRLPSVLSL